MQKKYCLTLDKEFLEFVELNNIEDPKEFLIECYKKGFNIMKYGEKPQGIEPPKNDNIELKKEIEELKKQVRYIQVEKIEDKPDVIQQMKVTPTPVPTEKPIPTKKTIKIDREDLYDE